MLLNSRLFAEILATPNPAKIKVPNMTAFAGTTCLEEHIVAYKNLMLLYTTNLILLCKFFPTTLSDIALIWYTLIPFKRILTFAQLKAKFVSHFFGIEETRKFQLSLVKVSHNKKGSQPLLTLKKFKRLFWK